MDIPPELTDAELDALERASRPATPGPWRWLDSFTLATAEGTSVTGKRRNREHIAAWTPDVALRMLEELRFLRRLEQMRAKSTPPPAGRIRSTRPPTAKRRG